MKPYAIFLSLTENYAHLFNALYNSAELFGVGKYAEFVVMHFDLPPEYVKMMEEKTKDLQTKVRFVTIEPLEEDKNAGKVMTVKYYRYKIMSEIGKEYRSICFIDTDIFLASGIKEYFEIAAATDLIIGTNDNVVRNYKTDVTQGTAPAYADEKTGEKSPVFEECTFDGKFICNVPTFIDMKKYDYLFMDIFNHRGKMGMDNTWPFTGDLETMNIVFLKNKIKHRLMVLPSQLWTGVHQSIYRSNTAMKRWRPPENFVTSDEKSFNIKYLFMSETCEHVRAFHGRDWTSEKSERALKDRSMPKLLSQMEGDFEGETHRRALEKRAEIFDTIQAYFLFLQFHGAVSLHDVHKVNKIQQGRYEYMKKRFAELKNKIETFK
jgi:hypothetical protein